MKTRAKPILTVKGYLLSLIEENDNHVHSEYYQVTDSFGAIHHDYLNHEEAMTIVQNYREK